MRRLEEYKIYNRIEYISTRGIEILLLTDHDYFRLQERTRKQGLYPYRQSFWQRVVWSLRYILRG